jgi:septin family protein
MYDITNNVRHEKYRSRELAAGNYNGVDNKNKVKFIKSPVAAMEEERMEHVAKTKEMEMEQVLEMKVKEKLFKH